MGQTVEFAFDEEKATQAAAFLVSRFGNQLNYLKLMKLLYLADREALKKWGRPISGGPYVAMDNGPLISPAYDAVKSEAGSPRFPQWTSVFRKSGYDLELTAPIEFDALSKAEVSLLTSILDQFGSMDQWELVLYTHENCREWHDPQGSSIPIPAAAILEQIGRTPEEINSISSEAQRYQAIKRLGCRK